METGVTSGPKIKLMDLHSMEDRINKKTTAPSLAATQTTVMYMKCKHEMVNWSKWFAH